MQRPEAPDQKLERVLQRLMTAEQYAEVRHDTPYPYVLEGDGKYLSYFGAEHSVDPEHPQFRAIEQAFADAQPDLVMVEGVPLRGASLETLKKKLAAYSREEIIARGGEPVYTAALAVQNDVPWKSPEPSFASLIAHIESQGFSRGEILSWWTLLLLPQYQRRHEEVNFETYLEPFYKEFQEATAWEHFEYSYEHGMKAAAEIVGHPISVHQTERAADMVDPIPWSNKVDDQTVTNQIARASSRFRDEYMLRQLVPEIEKGKRVFVTFGASHAVMQEPALASLFSN